MDKTLSERRAGPRHKRPNFPLDFKRHLVEQSYEPGASTALIARVNDINANLLFKWRRHYLAGEFGPLALPGRAASALATPAQLMPVIVTRDESASMPDARTQATPTTSDGSCEVVFERAVLRIRGDVSAAMLKLLIGELSR